MVRFAEQDILPDCARARLRYRIPDVVLEDELLGHACAWQNFLSKPSLRTQAVALYRDTVDDVPLSS